MAMLLGRAHASAVVVIVSLVALALAAGCSTPTRPDKPLATLFEQRREGDAQLAAQGRALMDRVLDHAKAQADDFAAGRTTVRPAIDVLIISGGADWGAFAAGVLKGWGRVGGELGRPRFAAVTGVSTGALIAPFAFADDESAIDRVEHLYRNPKPDWFRRRGLLFFLPSHRSFADVSGLERELKKAIDKPMLARLAQQGRTGRVLEVSATDLDEADLRVFDLAAEAQRALDTDDNRRFFSVLLAASAIPAAFPPREIDGELFVDGAVTGNILYGGQLHEDEGIPASWEARFPGVPQPKVRYWVILNNQVRPPPQVTQPTWPAVAGRSISLSILAATLTAVRHLSAQSEIARLKRHADVELRIIAVPDEWVPPKEGVFQKETMNALADLGERLGANPASWRTEPP